MGLGQVADMMMTARALTLPTAYPLYSPKWQPGEAPFNHTRFAYNVRFPKAMKQFMNRLGEVDKTVRDRNAKRKWPYPYLVPSNVPSSIAV